MEVWLIDMATQGLVRADLWVVDHAAQPAVDWLGARGIGKYAAARGALAMAVIAAWASTAYRLSYSPRGFVWQPADIAFVAVELCMPVVVCACYLLMIRHEQGYATNVYLRPMGAWAFAPARLVWSALLVMDCVGALLGGIEGVCATSILYAGYHGMLLAGAYVLATRERPPARLASSPSERARAGTARA